MLTKREFSTLFGFKPTRSSVSKKTKFSKAVTKKAPSTKAKPSTKTKPSQSRSKLSQSAVPSNTSKAGPPSEWRSGKFTDILFGKHVTKKTKSSKAVTKKAHSTKTKASKKSSQFGDVLGNMSDFTSVQGSTKFGKKTAKAVKTAKTSKAVKKTAKAPKTSKTSKTSKKRTLFGAYANSASARSQPLELSTEVAVAADKVLKAEVVAAKAEVVAAKALAAFGKTRVKALLAGPNKQLRKNIANLKKKKSRFGSGYEFPGGNRRLYSGPASLYGSGKA